MLVDLEHYDGPEQIDADTCVVGGGAAGVALTRQLIAEGKQVCLLEAGGSDFEDATQDLYEGDNLGMPYYPVRESRLRFFGGTTNIWGGRCVPMQPMDFERRAWVPHSGWPIGIDDLEPHYLRAHKRLDLGEYVYDDRLWQRSRHKAPEFSPELFNTLFWRFDQKNERFGRGLLEELARSPNCRCVLHANVTHIQAATSATGVEYLRAQSLTGKRVRVRADNYVLACGAIENARLMLSSNDVQSNGIGNDQDQVGRYFMEHPHARFATLDTGNEKRARAAAFALWRAYTKQFSRVPIAPLVVPSPQLQQREQLLNTGFTFKLQRPPERGAPLNRRLYLSLKHELNPTSRGRAMWRLYRSGKTVLQRTVRHRFEQARVSLGQTGLHVMARAEQAPNPASRVQLSSQRDALGQPLADLNWQLGELDKQTLVGLSRVLRAEMGRMGLGELNASPWLSEAGLQWPVDNSIGNHPIGGYHHMGTTRMSTDPARGVVDADCRVHGYRNLYVAGSSVFTTGGWANPTLTLLALTDRLGGHLLSR